MLVFTINSCDNRKVIKEYFSNGHIKEVYTQMNGKFDGLYKSYYENGQIMTEGEFAKNTMVNEWRSVMKMVH